MKKTLLQIGATLVLGAGFILTLVDDASAVCTTTWNPSHNHVLSCPGTTYNKKLTKTDHYPAADKVTASVEGSAYARVTCMTGHVGRVTIFSGFNQSAATWTCPLAELNVEAMECGDTSDCAN